VIRRPVVLKAVMAAAVSLPIACGDGAPTPVTPILVEPRPTAMPTAAPTATPAASSGLCANGNQPVARFDIKVYAVRDENQELREFSPRGPFFVGETLRFDSQGKDRFGQRTNGCSGEGPRWSWGPDPLVEWNGVGGWMPSAKVLAPGTLTVTATFEDGSLDFPLSLELAE